MVLMRCHVCNLEEEVDVKRRSLDKVFLLILLWHCKACREIDDQAMDELYLDGLE